MRGALSSSRSSARPCASKSAAWCGCTPAVLQSTAGWAAASAAAARELARSAPVTTCRVTPAACARAMTWDRSPAKLSCVRFDPMSINSPLKSRRLVVISSCLMYRVSNSLVSWRSAFAASPSQCPGGRRSAGADSLRVPSRRYQSTGQFGANIEHAGQVGRCGRGAALPPGARGVPFRTAGGRAPRARCGGGALGLHRPAQAGARARCQVGGGAGSAVRLLCRPRQVQAPGGGAVAVSGRTSG